IRTDGRAAGLSRAMAERAARRCCLGWDFSTQQVPSVQMDFALPCDRPWLAPACPGLQTQDCWPEVCATARCLQTGRKES
uniref:Uncharacterized protein n=1 Tax=Prolemur simus TaxID=1328070 RepID=A0A8C8YR89_PROSS